LIHILYLFLFLFYILLSPKTKIDYTGLFHKKKKKKIIMIIKNKEKENPSACSIFIIVNWDLNSNNYYVEMKKKI